MAPHIIPTRPNRASVLPSAAAATPVPGQYPRSTMPTPKTKPPSDTATSCAGLTCSDASPNALSVYTPIPPTTTAVSIVFRTVKSRSRNCPTMTGYLVTQPFCRRNPKRNPVIRPSANLPIGSAMSVLLAEEQQRGEYTGHKNRGEEDPSRQGELQRAADSMAAGASPCQSRAEHEDYAAEKRDQVAFSPGCSEARAPQTIHGFSRCVSRQARTNERSQCQPRHQHPFPVHNRTKL